MTRTLSRRNGVLATTPCHSSPQDSTAPPLHRSTAPPLHRSTTPPLHHSTTPPVHYSVTPPLPPLSPFEEALELTEFLQGPARIQNFVGQLDAGLHSRDRAGNHEGGGRVDRDQVASRGAVVVREDIR
jgi:hypothetical protein